MQNKKINKQAKLNYSLIDIINLIKPINLIGNIDNIYISKFEIDFQSIFLSKKSMFFLIKKYNESEIYIFIKELYEKNVRVFVIHNYNDFNFLKKIENIIIIIVENPFKYLYNIIKLYRKRFNIKCIVISGCKNTNINIIKEWLYECLKNKYNILKGPKIFFPESELPLLICNIKKYHQLMIFDIGNMLNFLNTKEIGNINNILIPDIGIITDFNEKINKKYLKYFLNIFINCKYLIFPEKKFNYSNFINKIKNLKFVKKYYWGNNENPNFIIKKIIKNSNYLIIKAIYLGNEKSIKISCYNFNFIDNIIIIWITLMIVNIDESTIIKKLSNLQYFNNKIKILKGINNCLIINNLYYNKDLELFKKSLNFAYKQKIKNKTLIISDIDNKYILNNLFTNYRYIYKLLLIVGIKRIIGIGKNFNFKKKNGINLYIFLTINSFLKKIKFHNEIIIVNNINNSFNKLLNIIEKKNHTSIYEINLKSLIYNINYFRSILNYNTKIMAMVKAFSYGNNIDYNISNILEYNNVDYLGVAYVDEGVELRNNGINIPILVMNADPINVNRMIKYSLEPEIYNFRILDIFLKELTKLKINKKYPVHIKIDTGMHRLGFLEFEIPILVNKLLKNHKKILIKSIFSHLSSSEDKKEKKFTLKQILFFEKIYNYIISFLKYNPIKHILNSSGITMFPEYQYDMVRLGLSLYGISSIKKMQKNLKIVGELKTTISQIKMLSKGETIGYGRKFKVKESIVIGIISIGYADGINYKLSCEKGYVIINNKYKAFIIGSICMDMMMINITGINCKEGDEVILIGKTPSIFDISKILKIPPHNVLTSISNRVKGVYIEY